MRKTIAFAFLGILVLALTVSGQLPKPANQNIKIPKPVLPALFPSISNASYVCLGAPCREFGVQGTGFGASQGTHRLLINGSPIPVSRWTATSITATGPVWDVDHSYNIAIDDGSSVISNTLNKRFPFQWDGAQPNHGAPGTEIDLVGWGGGPAQTDKLVKVGTQVAAVVSWTQSSPTVSENHIHIRVPKLPAGTYPINVWKGGANITRAAINFIVN